MEKKITTDFKKYDYITQYENIIEKNPNFLEYSVLQKNAPTTEEKILYMLSIITIIYKEKIYENYYELLEHKFKKNNQKKESEIEIYEQIKTELKKGNFKNIYIILLQNKNKITEYIRRYFERKSTNYIMEKKSVEILKKIKKPLLRLNPLIINQLIQYNQKPLTQEEKIIGDILDYLTVADTLTHQQNLLTLQVMKAMMIYNYTIEELKEAIMFIINNVYQETMQNETDPNYEIMKELMENEKIYTNEKILEIFLQNDNLSNAIISSFLCYNIPIEEGRLEQLKKHPSYEYVKKRKK